ncbi:GDP dissociation inhibitor [Chondrus crispus]|uniref:Rab GDP dissociation inhibitor n=1 Tax=Chondrus crispus TaxID=2769 RepID=R7QPZ2_CHOCR|nr:GDP dissociation inhibitor [Chondrus crispus]CDF39531.1 GDP dissociation inhibitor [Chondrus crispus]|eukprot:XP_005713443.1 GDP dissociation inhibitor [Chondrus crispus]
MQSIAIGGKSYDKLADGEYDAVVLGTGLTECMLSGILSVAGLRVLHCDRNDYYGASCASLNIQQMFEKYKAGETPNEQFLGKNRDYNIDLIPKFIMAGGTMVDMLVHTGVTRYLEFKLVDGSFVFSGDRPHKVPATPKEAMTSSLMGLFEKNRCRQFFSYVNHYDPNEPSTHDKLDLKAMTMAELYKYYGLQPDTISFVGHALALYRDESYTTRPAEPTVLRIQLYAASLARHGRSPYLYPLYGLGELPQAFARLAAVHGGTYMLHTPVDEILHNEAGHAVGIRSGDKVAKCRFVAGDPSYFTGKTMHTGRVVRKYCILNSPPPNTRESTSCQIIIPAAQVTPPRKSDIYVLVLSNNHKTTPDGKYLALVSTTVESETPEQELKPGTDLLGHIVESFVAVDELYEPKTGGKEDSCFITRSYDATTHFESTVEDVFDVYKRIFGSDLVLGKGPDAAGSSS